ncbi:uncharacterized protein LOC136089315 [Hydra vulgaris]|uniref:Uncharacterized protein LOC136089315 n=1 Tax=Hydra vulgaris TaxID=6087 RepID=A0ABM4DAG6_HYDVU
MDEINNFLSKVLPEDIDRLLPFLVELGASSIEDLQFLNVETDLSNVLPFLKRRKLEAALASSKSKPVQSQSGGLIETSVVTPVVCNKSSSSKKMIVSIMDAIENHPLKSSIVIEAQKTVMDDRLHRLLVKVACSYLIDCYRNYPPPEHQLAMAKSIVSPFKFRACRSGNGHELYYCPGTSKGFLTNCFREIYRRYPADIKKYSSRYKKSNEFFAVGDCSMQINNEEYELIKTKLMHLVYTDRNENEIVELMNKSRLCRQVWIRNDSPTASMILEEFPRFLDTPLLLDDEFKSINQNYVENVPVLLETKISKQIVAYCKLTGKCIDIIGDTDTEGNSNTDALVLKSLKALVYLLPTMGKYRVSASAAMVFLIEELKDGETLEMFFNRSNARQQPFILSCGLSFFVVCDGKAIIVKPSKVSVAFDYLFESFFVFNLEYPKQIQVLYNFFQELVYKLPGSVASTKARKLFEEISHM